MYVAWHVVSSLLLSLCQKAPKKAKKRTAEGANSNVFSMFEQAQIQEFKEVKAAQSVFMSLIYIWLRMAWGFWKCMNMHVGSPRWVSRAKCFLSLKCTSAHTEVCISSSLCVLLCLSISIVHHCSMPTCLFSCPGLAAARLVVCRYESQWCPDIQTVSSVIRL